MAEFYTPRLSREHTPNTHERFTQEVTSEQAKTKLNHYMPNLELPMTKPVIGYDGFTITYEAGTKTHSDNYEQARHQNKSITREQADIIPIKIDQNVSYKFEQKVESWAKSIPPHLAKAAASAGITLQVVATPEQLPPQIRAMHARRHDNTERTYGHLPLFYNAGMKRIYFIEHPALTNKEQQNKALYEKQTQFLNARGVQDVRDFNPQENSFLPFEHMAWHELGHALDLAALGSYSLASEKFGDAFTKARSTMTAADKAMFYYYVREDKNAYRWHESDAAQQEVFAELFALTYCPKSQRSVGGGDRLQQIFAVALKAMRDENRTLFGYE
jgi:hypothetical protein